MVDWPANPANLQVHREAGKSWTYITPPGIWRLIGDEEGYDARYLSTNGGEVQGPLSIINGKAEADADTDVMTRLMSDARYVRLGVGGNGAAADIVVCSKDAAVTSIGASSHVDMVLNTILSDSIGITLAGNAVSLPIGTYWAEADVFISSNVSGSIPTCAVRLYRSIGQYIGGTSEVLGGYQSAAMRVVGGFTLASPETVKLQAWVSQSGARQNAGGIVAGYDKITHVLKLWKL